MSKTLLMDVPVAEGKYRVCIDENTGRLFALRHDEPWRDCCGDNLIFNLAHELEEARKTIKRLKEEVGK